MFRAMFRLGVTIIGFITFISGYEIYVWDKNHHSGGFLINGVHCPHSGGLGCSWYHDVQGVRTRVSTNSTLNLTRDNGTYDEYYLLDNQKQTIVEYALVVPSGNAGTREIHSYSYNNYMYACNRVAIYIKQV